MRTVLVLMLSLFMLASGSIQANAASVVPVTQPVGEPDPAVVKEATDAFNSLSRKEKKSRIKEVKKEIRKYRADKRHGKEGDTETLLLVILAILLPPLAVYLYEGEINNRFWISLILTLLGWLPGIIYALILILGEH